jgi:hypothetical protein
MQSNSFAEPKHKKEYPLRCPLAGEPLTRWLDDGVVGRGSNGEGLLGEAIKADIRQMTALSRLRLRT